MGRAKAPSVHVVPGETPIFLGAVWCVFFLFLESVDRDVAWVHSRDDCLQLLVVPDFRPRFSCLSAVSKPRYAIGVRELNDGFPAFLYLLLRVQLGLHDVRRFSQSFLDGLEVRFGTLFVGTRVAV